MDKIKYEVKTVELLTTGQYRAKLETWFNEGLNLRVMRQRLHCRQQTVSDALRVIVGDDVFTARYSKKLSDTKLGVLNPMYGQIGVTHSNFIGCCSDKKGYLTVVRPQWWTGSKKPRIFWHHFIWCTVNMVTSIPSGCVIHHIDGNKSNNKPSNLHLCTVSEHAKIHARQRREGVTTIPKGSTCKCMEALHIQNG